MGRLTTLWAGIVYGQFVGNAKSVGVAKKVNQMIQTVTGEIDFFSNWRFC
jgi:hypothetical protein